MKTAPSDVIVRTFLRSVMYDMSHVMYVDSHVSGTPQAYDHVITLLRSSYTHPCSAHRG